LALSPTDKNREDEKMKKSKVEKGSDTLVNNRWPIGRTITSMRAMTNKECRAQGWDGFRSTGLVLILDDGSKIFASQDEEGNGPGALFGIDPDGNEVIICSSVQ
jgi:hypothetical protein